MNFEVEKKAFGPDCTEGEKQALLNRVYMYSDNIIMYHEVPILSKFQIDIMFKRTEDLIDKSKQYHFMIDLTVAGKPSAENRANLAEAMRPIKSNIIHCAMFTGKNAIINLIAKFVMGGMGFKSYSISKDINEALGVIKKIEG